MDYLWAPWRERYILHSKKKVCIFCIKPKEKQDAKNYIVKRNKHSFSMLNIYPYNNGHIMIVPYRHISDLEKLRKEEQADILSLLTESKKLLDKCLNPHGYNIGVNIGHCSGAGYPGHIHFHVVPRWEGDTNFMPVLTGTKVVPQSLDTLYQRLKKKSQTCQDHLLIL